MQSDNLFIILKDLAKKTFFDKFRAKRTGGKTTATF